MSVPIDQKKKFVIQTYNTLEELQEKGDQAQCKVFDDERGHKF